MIKAVNTYNVGIVIIIVLTLANRGKESYLYSMRKSEIRSRAGALNKKMSRSVIYSQIIRLRAEGLSWVDICVCVGVSNAAITLWRAKDKHFRKAIERAEKVAGKGLIEHSIMELAKGAKEETTTIQYNEKRMVKGEEVSHLITKKIVTKVPNDKAIAMLAYKYAKGEYNNEDNVVEHTIRITGRERSLSIEDRKALLSNEGSEVVDVDYQVLCDTLEDEANKAGLGDA